MNKIFKYLVYCIFVLLYNCKHIDIKDSKFYYLHFSKNILNYQITPKYDFDKNGLMFSDQGAWFAYSFPDKINGYTGFSGPFLLTQQNGVWSSTMLSQLIVKDSNKIVSWNNKKTNSLSSNLEQVFSNKKLTLKQELVFSSGNTAIIQSTLKNESNKQIEIYYQWKSKPILAKGLQFVPNKNEIKIISSKTSAIGHILFFKNNLKYCTDSSYITQPQKIILKPHQSKNILLAQSFIFPNYSWEKETQLKKLIINRKEIFKSDKYARVLAKAQSTLQNNWRISAGELKHEGLFPSYHYKWFNGFWAWDSWKHAAGLSYYDIKLAKNQIRALFDYQTRNGFIPDCIYRDTTIELPNYRNTKPPLSVWAVTKIFKKTNDTLFLDEVYLKLKKYHYWWYKNRDHDNDGLCEYGSSDGTLEAGKWESGMDNAVRFDHAKMLKNKAGAYSMNQESIDLNAYLYTEKLCLAKIAKVLQKNNDNIIFLKEAKTLKSKIQKQFYSKIDGWFYDTNLKGTKFIKVKASEGWTPLWAHIATKEQANSVKNIMLDSNKFYTKVPLQTLSAKNTFFNPSKGYWRGPNWLDQAYFGIVGLRNYGFNLEANKATKSILENAQGILAMGKSIRENYNPITGKGLNAKNFSWSAAHIIMLIDK